MKTRTGGRAVDRSIAVDNSKIKHFFKVEEEEIFAGNRLSIKVLDRK